MDLNLFKNKIRKENILTIDGIDYNNSNIIGGVNYNQTVNSGTDIVLGSCTCATIEFELNNLNQLINNLSGKEITWKIRVETSTGVFEDKQMGIFIAEKPTKVNDTRMKVKAYDRMIKFDKIVDDWLRTVSYPTTLKNMLTGLCNYVGVPLATTAFLNDNYPVKFNFLGTNVKGRDVLKWIAEIAAKFATINELGQLRLGWYNSIVYSVNNSNYYNVKVEDYTVKKIDKLQVQVEENDIGVVVGTGTNAYVIQNNPLLYASTDAEIRPYVELIYNAIKDFTYIPFEIKLNVNPLIKAGNSFQVTTRKGQVFNAVVMTRKMTSGNDVYSATGNASRAVNKSLNQSIQQLRGKTNVLDRTIERTISKLYDADTGDLTVLTQTVNSFNSRVQAIEANMNFQYQQDFPPENPEIGDVWLNTNPDGFIVDLLTMTVDEMMGLVDYYGEASRKTYRWNGSTWEHIEDGSITELRQQVSEISQTVDNISLTVSSYDGRIGTLELTANSLESRISATETSVTEIEDTTSVIASRLLSAEGELLKVEGNIADAMNTAINSANNNTDTLLLSYSTTSEMNSAINQKADQINLSVDEKISDTISLVNQTTDTKLLNYSTTTEMNSAIDLKADEINLTVDTRINETVDLINDVDGKFSNYSTTTEMNTAIALSQDSILSTVSATYATKSSLNNYSTTTEVNSAINQKADEINLTVDTRISETVDLINDVDGKFSNYSTTTQMNTAITQSASSIISTVSATYATKTSVSTLTQTVGGFETRVSNVEGSITTLTQTTSGITAAVNAAKLEFNSSGLTIKNGGFKIMNGNTTVLSSTSGNIQITGGFTSGYATMNSQGLWLSPYSYEWSGEPSGGRLYFNTSTNTTTLYSQGWSNAIMTSQLTYRQVGNTRHEFLGGPVYITGDLYVNNKKIN